MLSFLEMYLQRPQLEPNCLNSFRCQSLRCQWRYPRRNQRSVCFSYSSICSTVNSRAFKESVVTLYYTTIPDWWILKKNIEPDEEELVILSNIVETASQHEISSVMKSILQFRVMLYMPLLVEKVITWLKCHHETYFYGVTNLMRAVSEALEKIAEGLVKVFMVFFNFRVFSCFFLNILRFWDQIFKNTS